MKNISFLLVFLLLLQSCNIYHAPTSVEAAVAADKKAQLVTSTNQKYKFRRLEIKNDRLIGITRPGSATAKKLAGMPAMKDGKYLEIDLSNVVIDKIKLRNESGSIILSIVAIGASLVVIWYMVLGIALSSSDFMSSF